MKTIKSRAKEVHCELRLQGGNERLILPAAHPSSGSSALARLQKFAARTSFLPFQLSLPPSLRPPSVSVGGRARRFNVPLAAVWPAGHGRGTRRHCRQFAMVESAFVAELCRLALHCIANVCDPQKRACPFVYLRCIQCHVVVMTLHAPEINTRTCPFLWG